MCGRYQLTLDRNQLMMVLRAEPAPDFEHGARYNIAPTTRVPVVRREGGKRIIRALRWGLVPHWAKDIKIGSRMINARSETVADKPAFRSPFKRRRCLVPATGVYEWKRDGKSRIPHVIQIKDADVFAMAGIWSRWRPRDADDDAQTIESFSILTCDPQGAVGDLHHRMPVILHPDHWDLWMDEDTERQTLLDLAVATPAEVIEIHQVNPAVNNVRNQGPEVAQRIDPAE